MPRVDADIDVKHPLQAVVLADSFGHALKPLTCNVAKVLLPLAGCPMLEYSLEWLATQGVEECVVVACSCSESVERYLKSRDGRIGGGEGRGGMITQCVSGTACVSAGEALRLIEQRRVIRGDFVLVSGDVVTNVDLSDALRTHRERRKKEKLAIMTVLLRETGADVREARYGENNLTVAMDSETQRIVHYEEHHGSASRTPATSLDASLFGEVENIRVRDELDGLSHRHLRAGVSDALYR